MKKRVSVCLLLIMALAGTGCGAVPAGIPLAPVPAEVTSQPPDTATHDRQGSDAIPQGKPVADGEPAAQNTVLVTYFSATGTTRGVAERIAALTGADLAEIVPALPYTSEDLDYHDRSTRASVEQNTPDARPEIANEISFDGYTTVFLGYPIWWGQAPRIMDTFVESHCFTGLTVIPFCTSGSSDIGQSDDTLSALAGSGTWLQGRRFPGDISEDGLKAWISEMRISDTEKALCLQINGTIVSVDWAENESVDALIGLVSSAPLIVRMSGYGGFEQVGPLGTNLPRNDIHVTTKAGDIVLYAGDQLVVFYGSNSWAYTPLGTITDKSASELEELLGGSDVTVVLSLE